jgi:hypothetical protein
VVRGGCYLDVIQYVEVREEGNDISCPNNKMRITCERDQAEQKGEVAESI